MPRLAGRARKHPLTNILSQTQQDPMSALLFTIVLVFLLIGNATDSNSEYRSGAALTLVWMLVAPILFILILVVAVSLGG